MNNKANKTLVLPLGILSALCLIFFLPVLFGGKTFFGFDNLFDYLPWFLYSPAGSHINNHLITDPVNYFYTFFRYYKDSLALGEFPLWFSHGFCGMPFQPNGSPLLYLLLGFLPVTIAHDAVLFIHLLLAAVFTFLFLKMQRLRNAGALLGAIAWTFNAYVMVWFEFEHLIIIAAMLPLTLLCIDRFFRRPSAPLFLGIAAILSYTMCSAHIQMLIYQLLFVEAYAVYRVVVTPAASGRRPWLRRARLFLLFNAALCCGIVMSSGIIAIYLDSYSGSQRNPMPFGTLLAEAGRMPFYYLLTMLFPVFFGSPVKGFFVSPAAVPSPFNNYNELCVYAGITVLFLASVCLLTWRKNANVRFLLCTALLTLLMAAGTAVYYPFARFVPGLNLSTPLRTLYLFGFSIALLSGFGADYLWRLNGPKRRALLAPACIVLLLILGVGALAQTDGGRHLIVQATVSDSDSLHVAMFHKNFRPFSSVIVQPIIIAATMFMIMACVVFSDNKRYRRLLWVLAIVIMSYELVSFGRSYNTAVARALEYPKTNAIGFLQKDRSLFRAAGLTSWRFLYNGFSPFGIDDVGGYASLNPRRVGEYLFLSARGSGVPLPASLSRWIGVKTCGSPLLDVVNMKYVCVPPFAETPDPGYKLVYDGEIRIFENPGCFPRAFFVDIACRCSTGSEAYRMIGTFTRDDFRRKVVLEPGIATLTLAPALDTTPARTRAVVSMASVNANRYVAAASCPANGFLVISNGFHPGWKAFVDGKQTPVLRANYIMQAVPVSAGFHTVDLVFRPKAIIAGLAVSGVTWSCVIVYFVVAAAFFLVRRARKTYGQSGRSGNMQEDFKR
jgi:hypothetical protein